MAPSPRAFHLERVPPRHCRWCAQPITRGRADRSWHDGREDEPNCWYEYEVHTRSSVQFDHVAARDGLRCWDCEQTPHRVIPYAVRQTVVEFNRDAHAFFWANYPFQADPIRGQCVGPYCKVEIKLELEVEHTVPLWRTTHLPWADRRPYFGPANLRLRCPACHKPKTKAEAAARAKEKRQAKLRVGAERKAPKRKILSRGFQAGRRPIPSRPLPKRKP